MGSNLRTAQALDSLLELYAQIILTREGLPELIASQHQYAADARNSVEALIQLCIAQYRPQVETYNAHAREFSLARQWVIVAMLRDKGKGWDSKTNQFLPMAANGPFYALEIWKNRSTESQDDLDSIRVLHFFVTRSDRDKAVYHSLSDIDGSILPVVLDTPNRWLTLDVNFDWQNKSPAEIEMIRAKCETSILDVEQRLPVPPELAKEYGLPEELETLWPL